MELIVDSRENGLVTLLSNAKVQQMDVGDFMFQENGEPKLILERKTYADLASSIQGGRYKNQKIRLNAHTCTLKGYLIEGPYPRRTFGGIPVSTLDSAILGTQIRDGFLVIVSQNMKHTAQLLLKLQKKLPEYLKEMSQSEQVSYESTIRVAKKDNVTPQVCYKLQLCQIPGVSMKIASVLTGLYPHMTSFVNMIQKSNANIELSEVDLGTRRLGKVLAQRIVDYMRPSETPTLPKKSRIKITINKK